MIVVQDLTKHYGPITALDGLSFTVEPGYVTGFLGPNGAGKSTTMRVIVGLDRPTSGAATVDGRAYRDHTAPLQEAGAVFDTMAVHPGRSAHKHLLSLALTHGIPRARVDEVLERVGLSNVAGRRVCGFSLGMAQRLGIAAALLGDPPNLLLDEPVNGLDPDGVRWIRNLLRSLAAEGRSVLVSSHLMSEMALVADRLVIISRGRLLAEQPVDELLARIRSSRVLVGCVRAAELRDLLAGRGATVTTTGEDHLTVSGLTVDEIAGLAGDRGLLITELTPQRVSLEDAYLALTDDSVEYQSEPVA
jgi:ABC-2 type transport system ATP-binding protein